MCTVEWIPAHLSTFVHANQHVCMLALIFPRNKPVSTVFFGTLLGLAGSLLTAQKFGARLRIPCVIAELRDQLEEARNTLARSQQASASDAKRECCSVPSEFFLLVLYPIVLSLYLSFCPCFVCSVLLYLCLQVRKQHRRDCIDMSA